MANPRKQQYLYNPHHHVKIWFSNNPDIFMNTENQMRLIGMREKNPNDTIHLVYDSSLLNDKSIEHLKNFCVKYGISPVDADTFDKQLQTDEEHILYGFYKDEITHLKEGGNLAVASDIIRWLPPVYKCGTYTDFDVPVDTTDLPDIVIVETPLLLNLGSLRIKNQELILTNNDYIAVVDPVAAKVEINQVQTGLIQLLSHYSNDFIEKSEQELIRDGFLSQFLVSFMKNRSESEYILKSKSFFSDQKQRTSRELRRDINEVMSDPDRFLDFNRITPAESHESVIERLRTELKNQLGLIKWLFFRKEYNEINQILQEPDDVLLPYLMKKERSLYLKSIVVCTTGPISIANCLFNGYVFSTRFFTELLSPYSFNSYGLQNSFQSKNSIGLHENIFSMMNFLGAEDGELNDSSWLENGLRLQKRREELLEERKDELGLFLQDMLLEQKENIERHIKKIELESRIFRSYGHFKRKDKLNALKNILACFKENPEFEFDIVEFRQVLKGVSIRKETVYAGWFGSQTKSLIEKLEHTCQEAVILGLTDSKKIALTKREPVVEVNPVNDSLSNTTDDRVMRNFRAGMNFFPCSLEEGTNPHEDTLSVPVYVSSCS